MGNCMKSNSDLYNYGQLTWDDDKEMGTVKWTIDDKQLDEFLQSPTGSEYSSEIFSSEKNTKWRMRVFPNGWKDEKEASCLLFLRLESMHESYSKMMVYFNMRCEETGASWQEMKIYNKATGFGWQRRVQRFSELSGFNELSFSCNFRILRIEDKDGYPIYKYPLEMSSITKMDLLTWDVKEDLIRKMAYSSPEKKFAAQDVHSSSGLFSIDLYPNQCRDDTESEGEIVVFLKLCALPKGISGLRVKYKIGAPELKRGILCESTFNYDNQARGGVIGQFQCLKDIRSKSMKIMAQTEIMEVFDDNGDKHPFVGNAIETVELEEKQFELLFASVQFVNLKPLTPTEPNTRAGCRNTASNFDNDTNGTVDGVINDCRIGTVENVRTRNRRFTMPLKAVGHHLKVPQQSSDQDIEKHERNILSSEEEWNALKKQFETISDEDGGPIYAKGNDCIVYKKRFTKTEEIVAVKQVHAMHWKQGQLDDMTKKIRAERDVMKELKHKNIVRFIDYFEWTKKKLMERNLCIVMEWYDGGNLQQFMNTHRKEAGDEEIQDVAQKFAVQINTALNYLHLMRIKTVHRDLKPMNIMLKKPYESIEAVLASDDDDILKIVDFGESKIKNVISGRTEERSHNVGTKHFMAPEMYTLEGDSQSVREHNNAPYRSNVDLWSFGAIIYYLLTERHAYDESVFKKHAADKKRLHRTLKEKIEENVLKVDEYAGVLVDEDCKKLMLGLLEVDAEQRKWDIVDPGCKAFNKWLQGTTKEHE